MVRRHKVEPRLPVWKEEGGFYFAEKSALEAAVRAGGLSEEEISRRMGAGFELLGKALDGLRLTQYEVQHVEWSIMDSGPPTAAGNSMAGLPDLSR